jgi:hypothetical protein
LTNVIIHPRKKWISKKMFLANSRLLPTIAFSFKAELIITKEA